MTRISASSHALVAPLRASDRRGGGAAIVNPVAPIAADRRADGHYLRGQRASDRAKNKVPSPSMSAPFATTGHLLAGMHALGDHERTISRPDAYEAVGRYEDRYFSPVEPGAIQQRYA